ncbi:MAG: type VI secretion system tip protein TssI/VgrG [Pseudomonadota bacterium]
MASDPLPLENRSQRVMCAKGTSDLYLLQADVTEGIGIVSEFEIEFLAQEDSVKAEDFLADVFTIEMDLDSGGPREWLGTCVECTYLGVSEGMGYGEYPHFKVLVRGWPWLLTRVTDCRIFQNMTADDIVKEIFSDNGFSDTEWKVGAAPPEREYCVQYRETSWNFVQRLLAEEGRFWYFDYSGGKDKLVICDDSAKLKPIPGEAKIELIDKEAGGREEIDYVDNWKPKHKVQTNKVTLNDYDFTKSKTKPTGTRQESPAKYEDYDYPGLFLESADGTKKARRRLEALTATTHRVVAQGIVKQLHPAGKMTLDKHPNRDQNKEHLVLTAKHKLRLEKVEEDDPKFDKRRTVGKGMRIGGYMATSDGGKGTPNEVMELQSVEFEAQIATIPYVPPPVPVPYPIISGIQTAEVVGPSGDEIYTDEHGRVKVQFHWDRKGEKDENTTCFIRVATPIAGKNWGMIHIPRIGQEVVVQFLEGNPDRPLILGSVYNDQQTPPFSLPDNKTRIGLVSDTHLNDDTAAKHELYFEEKKDEEVLRMQSEKDWDVNIKNSATINIGTQDKPDGDYDHKVWRHTTRSFGEGSGEGDLTEVVQNNFTKSLHDGDYTLTVESGSRITDIATDETLTVGGDAAETVSGTKDVTVTSDITITSNSKITLEVGGSSITMDPSSITIASPQISISADGTAELSSPSTTVKGDGMLTLQGGMVKIN